MEVKENYIAPTLRDIIEFIYNEKPVLIPFIDVFRKSISGLEFTDDPEINSAQIENDNGVFRIKISNEFCSSFKLNTEDVAWVLAHEVGHYILNHSRYSQNRYRIPHHYINIIKDMQVNSMLFRINGFKAMPVFGKTDLLAYFFMVEMGDWFYADFLTRPPYHPLSQIREDFEKMPKIEPEVKEKMLSLWLDNFYRGLSLDEIYERFIDFFPFDWSPPDGDGDGVEWEETPLPVDVQDSIKELEEKFSDYIAASKEDGEEFEILKEDGDSEAKLRHDIAAFDETPQEKQQKKLNVLKNAIEKVFTYNNTYSVENSANETFTSVVPHFSRREAAMLSACVTPTFYTFNLEQKKKSDDFPAIYIDFSGSAEDYKHDIIQLLEKLKDKFSGPYFLFTTSIEEVTLKDLRNRMDFSGGTSISCVLKHINQNKFKNALIITDGGFSASTTDITCNLYALLYCNTDSADSLYLTGKLKKVWYLN